MEKSVSNLLKLAKKVVGKNIYSMLKKIKEEDEFKVAAQYAIISALKEKYQNMEIEIKELESQTKDLFFARNKLLLIPSKIKHFQVSFDKNEFNKLAQSFKSVQGEIANV